METIADLLGLMPNPKYQGTAEYRAVYDMLSDLADEGEGLDLAHTSLRELAGWADHWANYIEDHTPTPEHSDA